MVRGLVAAALSGGLVAACAGVGQFDQRSVTAEAWASAHAYCKSIGVNPGSDAYALCRRRIEGSGSADEARWRKAVPDRASLDRGVQSGELVKP